MASDDHEGIMAAVAGEVPGAEWQRYTVHFERNVLSHVPPNSMTLSPIFATREATMPGYARPTCSSGSSKR